MSGWIVLDKPKGISSAAGVAKVRRLFDVAKAGHGGTLDPLATGVLPIALGEATKVMGYILDSNKAYRATVVWGESRDTEDAEGNVTGTNPHRPDRAAILAALPAFTGRLSQVPPAFSALKVGGRRAYAAARAGETVELNPREIEVFTLELVENGPDHAVLDVFCGKGTYIRALARDIAQALSTLGYLGDLRRTRAGPFAESQAISLATLEDLSHSARLAEALLPLETALDDIPALALDGAAAAQLRHGQTISVSTGLKDGIVFATSDTGPVAMARVTDGTLKPIRVFNSS
jgi:tRNA pseudouridine55 synthase